MFNVTFIKESFKELKLTTWPAKKELEQLLLLFFIGVVVCTALIFSVDYVLQKIQKIMYDWAQAKPSS